MLKVSIIAAPELWNRFLTSQPGGHLLQSYQWGELIEYQGGRVCRLGALEDGDLVGAMMLIVAPVPLPAPLPGHGFSWLYCPRGPLVAGPDAPALAALLEEAHALARKEHMVVLRLETNITEDDPRKDDWMAAYRALGFRTNPIAVHGRRSWVLDLRPDLDTLFASFRKAWRQDIHIAERRGVVVREAENDADFDAYYQLLQRTSKRANFFIHNKEHHREMLRLFSQTGDAVLYLAELDGKPIAAKMLIRFGDWCFDMFGATTDNDPSLPKTHLLQFRCLQWAKEHGCLFFDFRTIPEVLKPGEEMWGVYQFKKGFGGFSRLHLPTLDYVYRPLSYTIWRRSAQIRRLLRRIKHKLSLLKRSFAGRHFQHTEPKTAQSPARATSSQSPQPRSPAGRSGAGRDCSNAAAGAPLSMRQ